LAARRVIRQEAHVGRARVEWDFVNETGAVELRQIGQVLLLEEVPQAGAL
jgi:hypothetical protein